MPIKLTNPNDKKAAFEFTWPNCVLTVSAVAMVTAAHMAPVCATWDKWCVKGEQTRLQQGTSANTATNGPVTVMQSGTLA